ncbi:MAG: hypothetical protein HY078_06245 [Elusimicrobia bacterium]|nr:hypothetical protein [Elusimicrobiota bacterium]
MMRFLLLSTLLAQEAAFAQTVVIGDAWVAGQVAVGTNTYSGRFNVVGSSLTSTIFQVSGVDETPFLAVTSSGAVGMGMTPLARLDVNGSGDNGIAALELRNGNRLGSTGAYQMTLSYDGSANLRHAVRTIHSSTQAAGNGMDFLLWTPAVATTSVGGLRVMSLVALSTGASVHVMPIGTPLYQMVISNGVTNGAGTLHRMSEGTVSSRALKSDIAYLGLDEETKAYEEVSALKHAAFRYKSWRNGKLVRDRRQPVRRGLIYEDAPESIRSPGKTLVVDERVVNLELTVKELIRRLEAADFDATRLGGAR